MNEWFEILRPAPVLSTPRFSSVFSGTEIPTNVWGHPEVYEFVALPNMCFQVLEEVGLYILKIYCPNYSERDLYVDRRFGEISSKPIERICNMPSSLEILRKMEEYVGVSYVWGGNWAKGIPEMLDYYPAKGKLSSRMEELWTLRGVDCSGLLYEITGGATPRNTSQLMNFGTKVTDGTFQPMDMIIHKGHVLFVRDQNTIIESKANFGVRIRPLEERIAEIEQEFGENYSIRRFTEASQLRLERANF